MKNEGQDENIVEAEKKVQISSEERLKMESRSNAEYEDKKVNVKPSKKQVEYEEMKAKLKNAKKDAMRDNMYLESILEKKKIEILDMKMKQEEFEIKEMLLKTKYDLLQQKLKDAEENDAFYKKVVQNKEEEIEALKDELFEAKCLLADEEVENEAIKEELNTAKYDLAAAENKRNNQQVAENARKSTGLSVIAEYHGGEGYDTDVSCISISDVSDASQTENNKSKDQNDDEHVAEIGGSVSEFSDLLRTAEMLDVVHGMEALSMSPARSIATAMSSPISEVMTEISTVPRLRIKSINTLNFVSKPESGAKPSDHDDIAAAKDMEDTDCVRQMASLKLAEEAAVEKLEYTVVGEVEVLLAAFNYTGQPTHYDETSWVIFDKEDFSEVCCLLSLKFIEDITARWKQQSDDPNNMLVLDKEDKGWMEESVSFFFKIRREVSSRLKSLFGIRNFGYQMELKNLSNMFWSMRMETRSPLFESMPRMVNRIDFYFDIRKEVSKQLQNFCPADPRFLTHVTRITRNFYTEFRESQEIMSSSQQMLVVTEDMRMVIYNELQREFPTNKAILKLRRRRRY